MPRPSLRVLLPMTLGILFLPTPHALAQDADAGEDEAAEVGMDPISTFGEDLDDAEAAELLAEMVRLVEEALAASRSAEGAARVRDVRQAAAVAFEVVWGLAPGLEANGAVEIAEWGWKERWQVTGGEFDPDFVERLGKDPPRVSDPRGLGVMGRGRAVRGRLEVTGNGSVQAFRDPAGPRDEALASLNNVIGWTYLTTGLKVREVQPRFSLTHLWDAPREFWQSTADTGWLYEAYAQAVNILKTAYGDDVAEARGHVADLSILLEKVLGGVDRDGDGTVRPVAMEGGLRAALAAIDRAAEEDR